ncbi:MAG TPA: hypothetical protein PLF16_00605 [Candidatus Staskawiczbacteria bacterium]|nr:hypothetical protein [Candidatus Staskawiczbacteria bacterium]
MLQLIIFIIFLLSLVGISFVAWRKIPELMELPVNGSMGGQKPKVISFLEKRFSKIFSIFQNRVILHKILFSVKLIVSKIEHKIDIWLHSIRKSAQKKK